MNNLNEQSFEVSQLQELEKLIQSGQIGIFIILSMYYGVSIVDVKKGFKKSDTLKVTFDMLNNEAKENILYGFCEEYKVEPFLEEINPFNQSTLKDRIQNFEEVEIIWDDVVGFTTQIMLPESLTEIYSDYKTEFRNELVGFVNTLCNNNNIFIEDKKRISNNFANRLLAASKSNHREANDTEQAHIRDSLLFLENIYKYALKELLKSNARYYIEDISKYVSKTYNKPKPYWKLLDFEIEKELLLGLLKDFNLIHIDTKAVSIGNIFKKQNTSTIKWNMLKGKKGKKIYLYHFINTLIQQKIIDDSDNKKWVVASELFTDINGGQIELWNNIPKRNEYTKKVKSTISTIIASSFIPVNKK